MYNRSQIERTRNGVKFIRTGRVIAADGLRPTERHYQARDFYVEAQLLPVTPQRIVRIHVTNIDN